MYIERVCPHIVYEALTYMKSYNKFYEDIYIAKGFSSKEMFRFSDIAEILGQSEYGTEKKCF